MVIKYNEEKLKDYQDIFSGQTFIDESAAISCGECSFQTILKMCKTIENFSEVTLAIESLEKKEQAYFGSLIENMNKMESAITKGVSNE